MTTPTKRFLWNDRSVVYHDRLDGATEQCNLDQLRGREEGDTPPRARRLCKHCQRMALWRRTIPT